MVGVLSGKTALVTGAARGIGRATALMLREQGAAVIGFDLLAAQSPFDILPCDIADERAVVEAVEAASGRLGAVDILVNNAGMMIESALAETSADRIDRQFAVNVRGTILVTREALKAMRPGGRIINVASDLAFAGRGNFAVYAATKGAIVSLTRSWARELAPDILVNAVAPGPIDTDLLGFETLSPEMKAAETAHPLGRIGKPDEVAAAIAFLAGPGGTFFTGQCLGANGGSAML
jgi:3-oxoacyl-[acyl-carrier protein] reductase